LSSRGKEEIGWSTSACTCYVVVNSEEVSAGWSGNICDASVAFAYSVGTVSDVCACGRYGNTAASGGAYRVAAISKAVKSVVSIARISIEFAGHGTWYAATSKGRTRSTNCRTNAVIGDVGSDTKKAGSSVSYGGNSKDCEQGENDFHCA